jgi:hypothetical protein
MILGCHPEIEALGQFFEAPTYFERNQKCSCGQPARSCALWGSAFPATEYWNSEGKSVRPVSREVWYEGWLHRRFGKVRYVEPKDLDGFLNWNVDLFKSIGRISGRRILVDSSKIGHRLKWLARSGADGRLDIRPIHLVRNGLAVLNGHTKRGYSSLRGTLSWYARNRSAMKVIQEHYRGKAMRLRYEDLCRQPESVIRSVCEFIGVEYTPAMMDFRSRTQHQVGGNPVRFGTDKEIRLDERWRQKVGGFQRLLFKTIAGRLQGELGYDD